MFAAVLAFQAAAADARYANESPPPARTGGTDILKAIPSDASFVAVVCDLGSFDAKVRAASKNLGTPVSPYTALKSWLEIATGLEDQGSAAMVFMPKASSTERSPDLAMLLPTVDRADLLAFLNPTQLSDGNAKLTLRGHDSYAATKDGYTVFAPDLRVVRFVAGAGRGLDTRWSPYQAERFRANDVTLWLDPSSLGPGSAGTAGLPPSLLEQVGSPLREMGLSSLQLSGRMEPAGIFLELLAQVPPAPAIAPRPEGNPSLLSGLPDEPVVFAFGAIGNAEREPWGTCLRALMSYLTKAGICSTGRTDRFVEAATSTQAMVRSMAVSVALLPSEEPGLLAVTKVLHTQGDGTALVQQIERTVETLRSGLFTDPAHNAALQRIAYLRAAETSSGIAVDHVVIDLSGYETAEAAKLRALIGGDRLTVRVAIVEPGQVVVAFGGGVERFGRIVDTVRAKEAPLATRFKLPPPMDDTSRPRWFEGYLSLDQWSRLVRRLPSVTGKPTAVPDVRDVDAPLVITAHRPLSTISRVDFFIPLEWTAAFREAWMPSAGRSDVESR